MRTLSTTYDGPIEAVSPTVLWIICHHCGYVVSIVIGRDVNALSGMVRDACRMHRGRRGCRDHKNFRSVNGIWRKKYGVQARIVET